MKNIFVGNLPFSASEDDIRDLFAEFGEVQRVSLIMHRDTGKPRGFGFVEMENSGAAAAIEALNGVEYRGRPLAVNEARDKSEGGDRSGGTDRSGGGYRSGGLSSRYGREGGY